MKQKMGEIDDTNKVYNKSVKTNIEKREATDDEKGEIEY